MLWGVQEGGHRYGRVEHQALVDSCDLALPQRRDFGLPLSDGRREGGALVGLSPGSVLGGRSSEVANGDSPVIQQLLIPHSLLQHRFQFLAVPADVLLMSLDDESRIAPNPVAETFVETQT
jgi:hypothetical protein